MNIKRMREDAVLPKRSTDGSAGYDLCACVTAPVNLPVGEIVPIPTGIAIQLPDNLHVALVFGRSGLGHKHGIAPANKVGVIDADYRGEIIVALQNLGKADYLVQPGERIAQMVILPIAIPELREVQELDDTLRGAGGFGSTGRQ